MVWVVQKNAEKAQQCFDYAWPLLNKNTDTDDGSFDRLVAEIYLHGDRSQPKSIIKAKEKYISAAQKGDGPALYELACNFLFGEEIVPGWETNKEKAMYYAQRAVLHPHYNNKYAGYIAGILLDEIGETEMSMNYFEQAAHLGQDDSQVVMALYWEDMGVYELATPYYRRAYAQGNIFAQFKLGYCHYYGLGIECDRKKGLNMIYCAANEGDDDAKLFLKKLH